MGNSLIPKRFPGKQFTTNSRKQKQNQEENKHQKKISQNPQNPPKNTTDKYLQKCHLFVRKTQIAVDLIAITGSNLRDNDKSWKESKPGIFQVAFSRLQPLLIVFLPLLIVFLPLLIVLYPNGSG